MFLHVKFHDNDFAIPMTNALLRLYEYVHDNNMRLVKSSFHLEDSDYWSIPEIFERLQKANKLHPMFHRLWVLEYFCGNVEFATRGLYNKEYESAIGWPLLDVYSNVNWMETYLHAELTIHTTGDFKDEWQNGEHGYLNLLTGEVGTF